jgi:catechol 2,3-dioxygenase
MIDPGTTVGPVHLTVSDLDRLAVFYERHLGMSVLHQDGRTIGLGQGNRELLRLSENARATRPPRAAAGLYHFALLVPSRLELAKSLRRLVDTGTPLQGASDHGVSEALYLADPDGNGIEIYRDRPRAEWPRIGGRLNMTVDALDIEGLLDEAAPGPSDRPGLAPGTIMGHVHLQVSRMPETEIFYAAVLGFDVMQRYGHGALFVSAGGYHHHIGLNTWAGVGIPPAPHGSLGLEHFVVTFASRPAREDVMARLSHAGIPFALEGPDVLVSDPSGNALALAV